jgi:predicted esterase
LGFSQGGATAIRFSHAFSHYIDALIVWGSDFPKEVMLDFKEVTSQVKKYFVLGDQDPFFEFNLQDRVKEQMRLLGFESVSYEGKHKVEQEILDTIIAKIRNGEN